MEFRESLRGPATTGVSWRLYTENVDMRAKSYKEDFQLLTHDNLNVTFEVNTRSSSRTARSRRSSSSGAAPSGTSGTSRSGSARSCARW